MGRLKNYDVKMPNGVLASFQYDDDEAERMGLAGKDRESVAAESKKAKTAEAKKAAADKKAADEAAAADEAEKAKAAPANKAGHPEGDK